MPLSTTLKFYDFRCSGGVGSRGDADWCEKMVVERTGEEMLVERTGEEMLVERTGEEMLVERR